MWKYIVAFVVVFGLTVFVSYQTQQFAEQDARQSAPISNGAAASNAQNNQAPEILKNPKQNAPFWLRFFFQLFTWPQGVTAWAILLTLFAIAEQTQQTRKAAEAASISAKASNAQIQVMQAQAGHMERQSKILEDSVAAAQKAADAAVAQVQSMKDKERGRLRVELQELDLTRMPGMGNLSIRYKVILSGSTQANILNSACRAGVVLRDEIPGPGELFPRMIIPQVVTPAMEEIETSAMVLLSDDLVLAFNFTDELIQSIKDSERRIFCEGHVHYQDIFGGCWVFKFKQKWAYFSEPLPADPIWQGGNWENYGDDAENGEYKDDRRT